MLERNTGTVALLQTNSTVNTIR